MTQKQNPNGTTQTNFAPPPKPDRLAAYRVQEDQPSPGTDDVTAPTDTGEPQSQPAGKPDEKSEKAALKHFNDLAGKLGVDVQDLYSLEISTNDGKKLTVQELKNEMDKRNEFTARELEWETEKRNKERQYTEAQNQLRILLNALPKSALSPQVLEAANQRAQETTRVEQVRTLEAIPEWKNETVRNTELNEIAEFLQKEGVEYLAQQVDHRLVRFLRNVYRTQKQLDKAMELVKQEKATSIARSKAASAPVKKDTRPAPAPGSKEARMRAYLDNARA